MTPQLVTPQLALTALLATSNAQPTSCCVVVPAQNFDQDVFADITRGWNNFVQTGQIWALLIGLVLGYFIRNLTAS